MADGTLITLISLGVTLLFMLGVPVLLVIGYWVIGCSFVLGLTLDNMGAELLNVFNKGFALLAMPLFILTGDLINKSGIARRLSDFAYFYIGSFVGGGVILNNAVHAGRTGNAGATYLIVDGVILLLWARVGERAALWARDLRGLNRACGALMIAAAGLLAAKDVAPGR